MHENNSFVTLTYDEKNLLSNSLCHRDWQLFIKRVRKHADMGARPHTPDKISYYMAGEYGGTTRRPHFHACIFGWTPNDKQYWKRTPTGSRLYISSSLNALWKQGFTSIGDVTFESAAYIARYIMDKKTGPLAGKYYEHINELTGEIEDLKPEYNKMSLGKNNAIGKKWLQQYLTDAYPSGEILIRKHKSKTPKYYDKQYKLLEPDKYEQLKMNRELQALEYRNDNTPARLKAKEIVKRAQINSLLRTLC